MPPTMSLLHWEKLLTHLSWGNSCIHCYTRLDSGCASGPVTKLMFLVIWWNCPASLKNWLRFLVYSKCGDLPQNGVFSFQVRNFTLSDQEDNFVLRGEDLRPFGLHCSSCFVNEDPSADWWYHKLVGMTQFPGLRPYAWNWPPIFTTLRIWPSLDPFLVNEPRC